MRKSPRPSRAPQKRAKTPSPTHAVVLYPCGLEARWGISGPTRWRYERARQIPARDFLINGEPVGWRVETIERHERGEPA